MASGTSGVARLRSTSPIRFTVASGVRSSWAITPMVLNVLSNRVRRRLALDAPSSSAACQAKPITISRSGDRVSGSTGPRKACAASHDRPSPMTTPTVASRQSVRW